ncbi:hypothetical protein [Streptosporangium sp. NPDC006930]|uniref:hypothetical protein n=1 Tax=unclassified Streptosporangium TaxID=2632669 RepID=UPI00342CBC26
MPDKALSLPEIAALLVLMIEAREISNPELKELHGLTFTKQAREKLNDLKLVESRKGKRGAFFHTLTDAGWACLNTELRAGIVVPKGSSLERAALRAALHILQGFMKLTDHNLADVVGGNSAAPDVEQRIRAAYRELAAKPDAWVSLTKLRPLLGEVPRATVDETLIQMNRMKDVNIAPDDDQKMLSKEDRDAAVTIGEQEKHLLWIEA